MPPNTSPESFLKKTARLVGRGRWWSLLVLASLLLPLAGATSPPAASSEIEPLIDASGEPDYAPDQVLVRFRPGVPESWKQFAHANAGAAVLASYDLVGGLQLVRLPKASSVKDAVELYQKQPGVLYAEPNYVVRALIEPNDPSYASQWNLRKIRAPEAWDLTTGSPDVVVAVIDTGIDYTHEDLAANMFRNEADCDQDGTDDDGNGYADDCYGVNAITGSGDPKDDHGHGTHVAGVIGAAGNNGLGVAGVNWAVHLLACKFLGQDGSGLTSHAIRCLNYVAKMRDRGANIVAVNASWGGAGSSQALMDAIDALRPRGILFVAAAGNAQTNNDVAPFYPAVFYLPNLIAVAATDGSDRRWYSIGICPLPGPCPTGGSNAGRRTVHLGAPGVGIMSSSLPSKYLSGRHRHLGGCPPRHRGGRPAQGLQSCPGVEGSSEPVAHRRR